MNSEALYGVAEKGFYALTFATLAYNLPCYLTIFVLIPLALKLYTKLSLGFCRSINRLDGKTVIVTGANTGIGLETAKDLAARGAKVILACRNITKGNDALERIKAELGDSKVNLKVKQLDLSSLASVRKFASEIIAEEERLDILVNNAGGATAVKKLTDDKLEANFQSNHFGPFLLTNLLLDLMRKTGNARIVMVASEMHKFAWNLDLDNLNSEKTWEPTLVYSRTKLANILMAKELDRRLREKDVKGVTINSLHPGAVRTEFTRHVDENIYVYIFHVVNKFFFKNVFEGAQTTIHVAVSEELEGVSGKYFSDCKEHWTTSIAKNGALAKQLWERSAKAVGLKQGESILN